MKRFFLTILANLVILFNFANLAQAQPLFAAASTVPEVEPVSEVKPAPEFNPVPEVKPAPELKPEPVDAVEQLKTILLPQIQAILTPEQQKQLETSLVEGNISIRKAFKSLTLTSAQKTQLATVFKSLPKKEVFTAMGPVQKREFFMKKKEIFQPTPEEIAGYAAKSSK